MPTLITVLGMHRSGTSATAGTLQEHGVEMGPVSEANRFNPRGNREIRALTRLHDRILERSDSSWWKPPKKVAIRDEDRRERAEILATIPGEVIGVKDPRMLLLLDFWRELEPARIGVIRNPVAVCGSLERRARERGKPALGLEEWEALWRHYNRILLDELEHSVFPVIDFDRSEELDAQVRAALAFHGVESRGELRFFDPDLVRESPGDAWRSRVLEPATTELWDRLSARTAVHL